MYYKIIFNTKKQGKIELENVSSFSIKYEHYVSVVHESNKLPVVSNVFKTDIYSIAVLGITCPLIDGQEIRTYNALITLDGRNLGMSKVFSERIEDGYLILSEITGFSKDQKTMYYTDHYISLNDVLRVTKSNIESCVVQLPKEEISKTTDNDDDSYKELITGTTRKTDTYKDMIEDNKNE